MLDRRQFLSAAAAGAALTLAGLARVDREAISIDVRALAHPDLLVALGAETVREIGTAYRALAPAERDRASLEAALRAELRAARPANVDAVGSDFGAGRVIVVSGWVLSRTEARQCALFSLRGVTSHDG